MNEIIYSDLNGQTKFRLIEINEIKGLIQSLEKEK